MDSCPKHPDDPGRKTAPRSGLSGKEYWRSLDELAETPQFKEYIEREFPRQASEWRDQVSRRTFLALMAASLGLAGLGVPGCTNPREEIIPYVVPPEQAIPGRAMYFATAMPFGGYGLGLLAESINGRPIKLEGNPDHPASLGATDVHAQASILSLYDPDRAQTVTQAGQVSTWAQFIRTVSQEMAAKRASGGAGLHILTETTTSPTLMAQMRMLLQQSPKAVWHHYEPVGRDHVREGATLAFGRPVNTVYRFAQADRILSLDSDFLLFDPGTVRYNREVADRRRVRVPPQPHGEPATRPHAGVSMSRIYAVESTPTLAGVLADHHLRMAATDIEAFAREAMAELRRQMAGGGATPPAPGASPQAGWTRAMIADLLANRGRSVVVAGDYQPPVVHAIAHAMNEALGAVGRTVVYTDPIEARPDTPVRSLRDLVDAMNAGQVDMLVILSTNPVYTSPADIDFLGALRKVRLRIHHSLYYDETSFHCDWHVPETHYLEMWSDIRAFDGTATIIQPLIAPLYQSRSPHELMAVLLGQGEISTRDRIRQTWQARVPPGQDFEVFWRTSLASGVVEGTAAAPVDVRLAADPLGQPPATRPAVGGLELIFRPDSGVFDGRYANNGWLQELPRPLTKLTWDNVACFSPATARRLGLSNEDVVRLQFRGRQVEAPVWVLPGQPADSVTVQLGHGRTRAGRVGSRTGFDAYAIRPSEAMWFGRGLEVVKIGRKWPLACTQLHQMMEGRDLIRVHSLEQFRTQIDHPPDKPTTEPETGHGQRVHLSLYPEFNYSKGHAWGMAIDNNVCTGCSACVVACQAENNIPVVGKTQVLAQREMHWLRIDHYYKGSADDPQGPYFEPMLCQHCEKAPCEYVCPVYATSHSAEGINEMTYNRCIGTRYCSNNCPYKVRRFNFLQYADTRTPVLQLMWNPDVTVRSRGVMEKCTFCIQRVNQTRREEKVLQSRLADAHADDRAPLQAEAQNLVSSLQTACQQACPTRAIVFGDLNHRTANGEPMEVTQMKAQPHSYGLLTELNTQPRISYLARFTNLNPEMPTPHQELDPPHRLPHQEAKG